MAASEPAQPKSPPEPQVIPPQQVLPATQAPSGTSIFQNLTQIAGYVPHNVWTTEALMDYHAKLHNIGLDNNTKIDKQRGREHAIALTVLAGFAAVLAVGFWFAYMKIDFGRDIVISAVSAALGYAGGFGMGLSKRQ